MTAPTEPLRARRRRETRERIAEAGLRMFAENGYEATSLEAVAAAAGVSARTLFYYFRTKPEILQYWLADDFGAALTAELSAAGYAAGESAAGYAAGESAWVLLRRVLTGLVARHDTPEALVVDRIFASTPALGAYKQGIYADWEQAAFAGLVEACPQMPPAVLRTAAMMGIGCLRLALEARRNSGYRTELDAALAIEFGRVADAIQA
jgi:AcrR family transcriptional regulator